MTATGAVPRSYRGVWARTLLKTPTLHDDSSFVRWLQTPRWHADLRVPPGPRRTPDELAAQQGFSGLTTVERQGEAEVCTWHRQLDFQPPRGTPDAGTMHFEGPDRLIETGLHSPYHEVWERVPGSEGRSVALVSASGARLLLAGRFVMHVRPRRAPWPADCGTADSLASLVQRHPHLAAALLDFEISYGELVGDRLTIQHATLPAREGTVHPCTITRQADHTAGVRGPWGEALWRVLDWDEAAG
ncbi:hypothetical protein ACVNIS_01205 [Sphaerotilaceae bacterium SBD11-9]